MTALHPTTRRRLLNLPQVPNVWEGDRRSLAGGGMAVGGECEGDCVLWVDGSEGAVRAIDIVAATEGPEAVVRTLLRAMEKPHSQVRPARPRKIVVCNREVQFFLRGALQGLEIAIDYVPDLPLIDELFRSFGNEVDDRPPALPPNSAPRLLQVAADLWESAPWEYLADSDILAVEIDRWDVGTVYACVMGMLGREYGLLLYRSLESLLEFRRAVLCQESLEALEQAFLQQDCWFLNFEPTPSADPEADRPAIEPSFGSVHPLEGLRPFLSEEETWVVYVALRALQQFTQEHRAILATDPIEKRSQRYDIPVADLPAAVTTVSTLPELGAEFLEMLAEADMEGLGMLAASNGSSPATVADDLIPEDAVVGFKVLPWTLLAQLRDDPKKHYPTQAIAAIDRPVPVVVVQTSRPKAKALIDRLERAGGLTGIGFNSGFDPQAQVAFDVGLLQLADGGVQLLAEFPADGDAHIRAKQHWHDSGDRADGACALIVASGVTGLARGNPGVREMMAVFETQVLSEEVFGLGTLRLVKQLG